MIAAARRGDADGLRLAAAAGLGLDKRDAGGATPLMHAAAHGHVSAVEYLLGAGASHALADVESGYTALHRAFLCGKLACAAALVRAGAGVDAPADREGCSPLELLHRRYGAPPAGSLLGSGELYTWGEAGGVALGRAAHDGSSHAVAPGRCETAERVVAVAASKHHTLLITVDGALRCCGLGVGGRLGRGDERHVTVPRRVPLRSRAVCISAGLDHSLVVLEGGEIFSWGSASAPLGYDAGGCNQLSPRRVRFPIPAGGAPGRVVDGLAFRDSARRAASRT